MKIRWKVLVISLVLVYFVAFLGSLFTDTGEWYTQNKPEITPPGYIFPIVWNILFFLIALSIYFAWTSKSARGKIKDKIVLLFSVNLFLNLYWSFLFFYIKDVTAAFFDLILLWASILILIIFLWRIEKKASVCLWPYLLWVSFAGVLNYLFLA